MGCIGITVSNCKDHNCNVADVTWAAGLAAFAAAASAVGAAINAWTSKRNLFEQHRPIIVSTKYSQRVPNGRDRNLPESAYGVHVFELDKIQNIGRGHAYGVTIEIGDMLNRKNCVPRGFVADIIKSGAEEIELEKVTNERALPITLHDKRAGMVSVKISFTDVFNNFHVVEQLMEVSPSSGIKVFVTAHKTTSRWRENRKRQWNDWLCRVYA